MNGIIYVAVIALVLVCAVIAAPVKDDAVKEKPVLTKYGRLVEAMDACNPNEKNKVQKFSVTDTKVTNCKSFKHLAMYRKKCPEAKVISDFALCFRKRELLAKKKIASAATSKLHKGASTVDVKSGKTAPPPAITKGAVDPAVPDPVAQNVKSAVPDPVAQNVKSADSAVAAEKVESAVPAVAAEKVESAVPAVAAEKVESAVPAMAAKKAESAVPAVAKGAKTE